VITVQPLGLSTNLGATVTLHVAAEGSAPLTFQWRFNGTPLGGATSPSLTLSGIDFAQAGTYQAVVSNPGGVVTSAPATLTVVGLDSDSDGIPDAWMIQNFGHATGLASDSSRPQDDADGDGLCNRNEYQAGTDPRDPQSCLKLCVLGMDPGTGRPQVAFTAVAGIDYTLEYAENLSTGPWQKLTDVAADPTTRILMLNDPGAISAPSRFYRAVTPMQP